MARRSAVGRAAALRVGSELPPITGPMLFGEWRPTLHTDSRTDWASGRGKVRWTAAVADEGTTWCIIWQGQRVGGGYASRAAAKRGLERHVQGQARVLLHAMGDR